MISECEALRLMTLCGCAVDPVREHVLSVLNQASSSKRTRMEGVKCYTSHISTKHLKHLKERFTRSCSSRPLAPVVLFFRSPVQLLVWRSKATSERLFHRNAGYASDRGGGWDGGRIENKPSVEEDTSAFPTSIAPIS